MIRDLFKRLLRRQTLITPTDYQKGLQKYRQTHPESLEEEREQINRWINQTLARKSAEQQGNREKRFSAEDARIAQALYDLKEIARAAFMTHPAATEVDFRRCWPSIREEMLKQHALEELAANPALSSNFARKASGASLMRNASQEPHSNLQLLKMSDDSD